MSDLNSKAFLGNLPVWNRFLHERPLPSVVANDASVSELRMRMLNLRRRLRDGPLAPLRMAFFGPTGAGKSKLFSSLIGKSISQSGFRRPFTRTSCYYVHDDWQPLVAAMQGQVELHQDGQWKDIVLIDTPDFDSVELANRDEAERVFLEADDFIFVTDALKYADASTWDYLQKIHASEKRFIVVLNKVNSQSISESFDVRYRETFSISKSISLPYHTIVVPEFPIPDDQLIDSQHPSIVGLSNRAVSMAGDQPASQSVSRFRGELDGVFSLSRGLLEEVQLRNKQLTTLRANLDQRFERTQANLEHRLTEGLEPAVRDEVYQRVQLRLAEIDLLRYPRKVISMPIVGLKSMYNKWTGRETAGPQRAEERAMDPVTTETFHMLESELIKFADESRLDVLRYQGLSHLVDRDVFKSLRLEHAEIQQVFRERHEEFRSWVETHARETATKITGENKLKFILSQVLFQTVLIGAQFQTAGGLSVLEIGFDGVVSPFVAKAVSVAIGNEKVKQFESESNQKHRECMAQVLAVGRDRFYSHLTAAAEGLTEWAGELEAIAAFAAIQAELVDQFAQSKLGHDPSEGGNG